MKLFLYITLLLLFNTLAAFGQTSAAKHHANFALDCQECHLCENPRFEKPCLKLFPDFKRDGITIHQSADEAPELFRIDVLSNIYEASIFTHKLHAEMADMSGGCVSCHHFNPPGKIVACKECHEPTVKRSDLSKPGLKGAYHRQCMACHQDWSHETDCVICHSLKSSKSEKVSLEDKQSFVGKAHKKIKEPDKLIFTTDFDDGEVVTFYHDEHINLFGIKCVQCHQNESCSRCHDTIQKTKKEKEDPHENCLACHEKEIDDNCAKCHAESEKARFNHKSTGWVLNRYHKTLRCQECHGDKGLFTKLNRQCNSCHCNWEPGKFEHKVTGLVLDENHNEEDCSSCHIERKFDRKTACDDCHDEYSYPRHKPGYKVKLRK